MQRWTAFARHARNYSYYISSSSSRIPNRKVSFSVSSNLLLRSSTSCNSSSSQFLLYISSNYNHLPPPRFFSQKITASKDFQKVLSFLSSNATEGYQIKPDLNSLQQHLIPTLHQRQQQHFVLKILNQLILSFSIFGQQGKVALEVFNKFEVFQCVPNQDTYDFTLQALCSTRNTRFLYPTAASSLCQKMLLHPETLLPDDGEKVGDLLSLFSSSNLPKEAYALYLAVNEKRKRNRNWSLQLHMLIPHMMLHNFCGKKETVQLALEMLTDTDIPEEVEEWEKGTKEGMCFLVLRSLCRFKYFDEVKQLIFKMIADGLWR